MDRGIGTPIVGVLNSSNASAGVAVPLFIIGADRGAYTLKADEYLEVHTISLVAAAGGACRVFFSNSATPRSDGSGDILRGTYAANGGERKDSTYVANLPGDRVWAIAPIGVVDVQLTGVVRKTAHPTIANKRPDYKEALKPG